MLVWGEYFAYPKEYFLQIAKETLYFCNRSGQCFLWIEIPCELSDRSSLLLRSLLSTEHVYILGRGNDYFWSLFRSKDLRFLENIKTRIIEEAGKIGLNNLPKDFRLNVYFYSGKSHEFAHEEDRFIRKWNKEFDFLKVKRTTIEHINKRTFGGVYIAVVKRFLDIIGSLFGMVIFSWVMLACAACVKIALLKWKLEQRKNGNSYKDSDSAVIFKQVRVGRNGKLFRCYKFRTMYPGADKEKEKLKKLQDNAEYIKKGPTFKMDNDPRILKFGGSFLRKHSLDELPQFFNVLIGDMSLVGPRPPTPDEVNTYLSWHYNRLSIKPGLTCTWQTSSRNDVDFDEWMRLDNRYIQERSTLNDLKLKLKTVEVMISGKGAS
ncbi:MAG: sugar transferase [Fibromonadaceae bacterium]|nr:sugar transferase [Fibromonadaceae bacterium]